MERADAAAAIGHAQSYLISVHRPGGAYFIASDGTEDFLQITRELRTNTTLIKTSDFCQGDVFPDFDTLFDKLQHSNTPVLLLGAGEAAFLSDDNAPLYALAEGSQFLQKVIVVSRAMRSFVQKMAQTDRKFSERNVCLVESNEGLHIVQQMIDCTGSNICEGFGSLLRALEEGAKPSFVVRSTLPLAHVKRYASAYDLICAQHPGFTLAQDTLQEKEWMAFANNENMDIAYPPSAWQTYLRVRLGKENNPYLVLAAQHAKRSTDYRHAVICALLHVSHKDKNFTMLYQERKKLLSLMSESDAAEYVFQAEDKGRDSIYYLTDLTAKERMMIFDLVGRYDLPLAVLEAVYPRLAAYLAPYPLRGKMGSELTDYFERYKLLKVKNKKEPSFIARVEEYAGSPRRYNSLDARGAVLESLDDGKTLLYWVDALGVEYLSYIRSRAQERSLKMHTQIVRAELPSLTSYNKEFFTTWRGPKDATEDLDHIAHDSENNIKNSTLPAPYHLEKQLDVIDMALDRVYNALKSHTCHKAVIASDHGASRMAVLCRTDNKWEMQEKGEHAGRCCPISDIDEAPPFASQENGFWVIANYDRFKGGRLNGLEVHGGATLEEVIVPVLTFTLADTVNIPFKLLTPTLSYNHHGKEPIARIKISYASKDFALLINNIIYPSTDAEDSVYSFRLDGLRNGQYIGEIRDADLTIGTLEFEILPYGMKENIEDFDFFQ